MPHRSRVRRSRCRKERHRLGRKPHRIRRCRIRRRKERHSPDQPDRIRIRRRIRKLGRSCRRSLCGRGDGSSV